MITSITVRDFLFFENLELELSPKFNVFAGETGAGKSILIQAIDVALGGAASKELIRKGADRAYLEVIFRPERQISIEDLDIDDSEELVVSREITKSSTRQRLNGAMISRDIARKLREQLLDIHSQNQTYSMLKKSSHMELLDSFGDSSHTSNVAEFRELYKQYLAAKQELKAFSESVEQMEARCEYLRYQISEIGVAAIVSEDEDEKLEQELKILSAAEQLASLTGNAFNLLYGGDSAAVSSIQEASKAIHQAAQKDPQLASYPSELDSISEVLSDIADVMRKYCDKLESDPERIDQLESRLMELNMLKRKYGGTLASALTSLANFEKELSKYENIETESSAVKLKIVELEKVMAEKSAILTEERKKIAVQLAELVTAELVKLELPKAQFMPQISEHPLYEKGNVDVEFMISINRSEGFKPLAKTASGGELSRVMLALKNVFAAADQIGSVIFDEIDTGISGKAAKAVSEELLNVSQKRQVICITHLPVIAARADSYFNIVKSQNETTEISVTELSDAEKIVAIARMASGCDSEEALSFAKELCQAK